MKGTQNRKDSHKKKDEAHTTNKCLSCGSHAKLSTSAVTDHLKPGSEGALPSFSKE